MKKHLIDLDLVSHLPAVTRRACALLDALAAGRHPLALGGKLLRRCPVWSLPVGRSYRLLVDGVSLRPISLVSHERYNGIVTHRRVPGRLNDRQVIKERQS